MSHTIDEQLSSLLDGELPVEQEDLLLSRLQSDGALRERFARYSIIGDVLTDAELRPGALQIADRVRAELDGEQAPVPAPVNAGNRGAGLFGAGLAAAAALLVALNLNPGANSGDAPQLAAVAPIVPIVPVGMAAKPIGGPRANLAPERMTRYLVTHAEYTNAASRQFIDAHVVMPAFQRAAWQTSGPGR